jgi:hypothetical protein
VETAAEDWLAGPMADREPKTVAIQREILAPLTEIIGKTVVGNLTADDVSKSLAKIAETR